MVTLSKKRIQSCIEALVFLGGCHGSFDPTWHTRLLALIMFGMASNMYHDFTGVPLWKIQGDSAASPIAGEDSEDDRERKEHDREAVGVEKAEDRNPQADEKKEAV